jgi:non-ribosomal peptide synthetase component F
MEPDARQLPEFTPTSGELVRRPRPGGATRPLAVLGDDGSPTPTPTRAPRQLAKGLLASGAGKGTRVGLLAGNSPDWIVGWLGITRMGGVAILLNTYNKARELGWLLRHSDAQVLLTVDRHLGHDYLERLEQAVPGLAGAEHGEIFLESHPYLRSIWTWGEGRRPWAAPVEDLVARGQSVSDALLRECEAEVTPADPMVVVYSSGSTADPKGRHTRPRPRRCATPTTCGRCATSSPTTCCTHRCRCSGSVGSASR